jgi:Ca-activated chloride channel family protein
LTYYTTNEKRDGRFRKINVSVTNPKLSARARRGYYAPKK